VPVHEVTAERFDDAERALEILLDSTLDPIVDMVLLARDAAYEARSHDGWVRFRRTNGGYEKIASEGADPLADQSTDRFAGLDAERAHPYPVAARTRTRSRTTPSPSSSTTRPRPTCA
jgi:hypothetical protein